MVLIYVFNDGEDPAKLSKLLWQHKIGHRIQHAKKQNELWLVDSTQARDAQTIITHYLNDEMDSLSLTSSTPDGQFLRKIKKGFSDIPVTMALLAFSIGVTLLTNFGSHLSTATWFYFLPIQIIDGNYYAKSFSAMMAEYQYWRLLTPAFLHLSIMHICFNLLWLWDIGRRVEQGIGAVWYLFGVLLTAVVANCAQFFVSGSPLFGGMSGVVYGVIGFAWLLPKLSSSYNTLISQPVMIVLMVFFALGYTDFFALLGVGEIANTAHLSGLLSGLILAVLFSQLKKASR
ncbi:rhomboid family intramembrane serine protease [Marinomonas agarivorans]|nr:rhomboid family intramembrane serine protease [Marinomonas agarivorans]